MTNTLIIGSRGEGLACDFLISRGFLILERNWRHKKQEVDLIATDGQYLRIVEVKSRSLTGRIEPFEAVNKNKQNLLIKAAHAYVTQKKIDLEVRFDIVSIVFSNDNQQIDYFPDAFYPVLRH
ncbi:MAG: YraN family protein [Bacteroidales bacterium]|nr:YraN family protein [Bacteroidales bacterium]